MKRRAAYLIPVFTGILLYFFYIRAASSNVAYSDYIRLIAFRSLTWGGL